MHEIKLREYEPCAWNGQLDSDQRRALAEAKVEVTLSPGEEGGYTLRPSSYIGAVNVGELAVVVRPKIPIDRVMFLIAYAMDPKDWRTDTFGLERDGRRPRSDRPCLRAPDAAGHPTRACFRATGGRRTR